MPWTSWSHRQHTPCASVDHRSLSDRGSAWAGEVFRLFDSRVCALQIKKLMLWLKGLLQTMLCFLVREFVVLHSWLIFNFSLLYKHKGINEVENTAPQLLLVKLLPLFCERSSETTDLVEIFLEKFSSQSKQHNQRKKTEEQVEETNQKGRQMTIKSSQLLFYWLLNKTSQIPVCADFAHGWL